MEVTVLDTGDLPSNSIMSFQSGSMRRHAQIDKNKAINLSFPLSEPVRVDLMSEVGSHTFHMVPGQEVYEVPISNGNANGDEVKLKFQIREANSEDKETSGNSASQNGTGEHGSPTKKLQTALLMRSYLDNHDVLRQMQELLQDMVTFRPDDPVDYMIKRLEAVCQEGREVQLDVDEASKKESKPTDPSKPKDSGKSKDNANSDSEESDEDHDAEEEMNFKPPPVRGRKCSVSEEAYGAYNERKKYQQKVIPKDDKQKNRLKSVLKQCFMFNQHNAENLNLIIDAMEEKIVPPNVRLITQGESGDVMWVIESGKLECYKNINGEEKLVKTCKQGDVFGELALLYNCPRAASVTTVDRCILWELDRETFKGICFEAASHRCEEYDGFSAPSNPDPSTTSGAPVEIETNEDGCEDEAGDSSDDELHIANTPAKTRGKRREGVSAEALAGGDDKWTPPVYHKSDDERQQLFDIIRTSRDGKLHMLFGNVSKETFEKIVDAMCLKAINKGEHVIEQGDVGDYFYIVKSGDFDIVVKKGQDPPKKVFEASVGFAFGELALLYNAPRSATITATVPSEVWSLDRKAFRNLVVRSAEAQFKQYVEFLNGVDVFQVLNENERAQLAEVLEEEEFEDDEAIVEQGEIDDKMFILRLGKAVACIKGEQGEIEVMHYNNAGAYFGEIALLSGEPRKASVYAVGPCTCLYISRLTFLRVLGPLQSLLERNINKYQKYSVAIEEAKNELKNGEEEGPRRTSAGNDKENEEEFDGGIANQQKSKAVNRKRERPVEKMEISPTKKVEKEPETLTEKVAQDFKNPVLVTPCADFAAPAECNMSIYGGLRFGEKFTNDKIIHVQTAAVPVKNADEDLFAWQGQTLLKEGTEIAIACQKGQKSASDPTPNQDNFFVRHLGPVVMIGVCDGHGPFGHLVSFRLVQTLPHYLATNQHVGKNWELVLKEGFLAAQKDLVDFCSANSINIEASGAAGSVLILEEQTIHIAHIGDARIMVGSWNRRDSRMIHCTEDHKPDLPNEKARLEAAGSEVREIDPGNHRIYLPGTNFPGLTMSRAFGDLACEGVLREPEYHRILMQPTDQWYAIVASDGIWEFMTGEEVCNLTAKKLRLKGPRETVHFLVNASRKRWEYCCQDYCDDITAILVQWNVSAKDKVVKKNHSLTVKRPEG